MIIIDPAQRPTAEDLKTHPWFDGIDWDAITYGPTAPRKYLRCTISTTAVLIDELVHRDLHAVLRRYGELPAVFYV